MKTILKLSILFLTIASVACKKDPPKEPDPPVATIPGFSIGDDGWIESPMWLADIVEHYDGWGVSVYIFKYEGEDCIHIINYASSYAFSGDRFFSLTGEDLINASYPATKEDYELLFAMKRAVKDAVFI